MNEHDALDGNRMGTRQDNNEPLMLCHTGMKNKTSERIVPHLEQPTAVNVTDGTTVQNVMAEHTLLQTLNASIRAEGVHLVVPNRLRRSTRMSLVERMSG